MNKESSKYDQDSEIPEEQEIICEQCNCTPDNYVKLDCNHNFCLLCLGYVYLQGIQHAQDEESNPHVQCSICGQITFLDQETVQALQNIIKDVLIPMIQQAQKQDQQMESQDSYAAMKEEVEASRKSSLNDKVGFLKQSPKSQETKSLRISNQQYQPSFITENQTSSSRKNETENLSLSLQIKQLQDRAQSYQQRLQEYFQVKLENLESLQQNKQVFQNKCNEIKESINEEFHKLIYLFEQQRGVFLNDLNYIEMVYGMQIQKIEMTLEEELQNIQTLNQNLVDQIRKSIQISKSNEIQGFQELLSNVQRQITDFTSAGNSNIVNKIIYNIKTGSQLLKNKLFTQQYKNFQPRSALENSQYQPDLQESTQNNEMESKNDQFNLFLNSSNDRSRVQISSLSQSKYLKPYEKYTPQKQPGFIQDLSNSKIGRDSGFKSTDPYFKNIQKSGQKSKSQWIDSLFDGFEKSREQNQVAKASFVNNHQALFTQKNRKAKGSHYPQSIQSILQQQQMHYINKKEASKFLKV